MNIQDLDDDVLPLIINQMDYLDIIRLSQTDRRFHQLYQSIMRDPNLYIKLLERTHLKTTLGNDVVYYLPERPQESSAGIYFKYEHGKLVSWGAESKNRKKEGTWHFLHPNGNYAGYANFDKGNYKGPFESYYENGTLESRGTHSGESSKLGYLRYMQVYDDGEFKTEYEGYGFELIGPYEEYYDNGNLKMKGNMSGYRKEGLWEYYYREGPLAYKGYYNNDRMTGDWKHYDRDGNPIQ